MRLGNEKCWYCYVDVFLQWWYGQEYDFAVRVCLFMLIQDISVYLYGCVEASSVLRRFLKDEGCCGFVGREGDKGKGERRR